MKPYIILTARSIDDLEKEVILQMSRGYKLSGGMTPIQGRDERGSYQWTPYSSSGQGTVAVRFTQTLYLKGNENE